MNQCAVDGCPTKPWARGWCHKHYERWRRKGDPTAPTVVDIVWPSAGMRRCAGCDLVKPITEYRANRKHSKGLNGYCKPCHSGKVREWKRANPDKVAAARERSALRYRAKKYGLAESECASLLASAGDSCPICEQPFGIRGGTAIDHNHVTGAVRGVVCRTCNLGLGALLDNPSVLRLAATYLERPAHVAPAP